MAERKLRAVEPDETKAKRLTITEAAEQGDDLAMMIALKARIASTLQDPKTPPRDLAALSLRLQGISQEIKTLQSSGDGDDLTEAAHREDAGFSAASV